MKCRYWNADVNDEIEKRYWNDNISLPRLFYQPKEIIEVPAAAPGLNLKKSVEACRCTVFLAGTGRYFSKREWISIYGVTVPGLTAAKAASHFKFADPSGDKKIDFWLIIICFTGGGRSPVAILPGR